MKRECGIQLSALRFVLSALIQTELIAHAFHGCDVVLSDLFTDFPDVNIYGPGQYIYVGAPDVLQQIFATEDFVRILGKEVKEFEFFLGKIDLALVYFNGIAGAIDGKISDSDET